MTDDPYLSGLLEDIATVSKQQDLPIRGLTLDSRQVTTGDLFLALRGGKVDGAKYVMQAQALGAAAVVVEAENFSVPNDITIPVFASQKLRQQVGLIADRFYQYPSQRINLVAITGTNGKTSSTYFLAQSLHLLKRQCAIIGTTGYGLLNDMQQATHTTPDAIRVRRLLHEFVQQNISHVAMEVSSHALQQGRVANLVFDAAVFTNLSRDHLDYHGNMENYAKTKASLFAWPSLKNRIVNFDDEFGRELAEKIGPTCFVYSLDENIQHSDFKQYVYGQILETNEQGFKLAIHSAQESVETQLKLLGRFNISNILAVVAILLTLNFSLEEIAHVLPKCHAVPGRMESFGGHKLPLVIVDYAHTPDALEKSLQALKEHVSGSGQLWLVFGCGGDRDEGKRPLMGHVAETWAQHITVTDDNPRHEDHQKIAQQILAGMKRPANVTVNLNRGEAIRQSIKSAQPGDIVLVAGKGHEEYQQVGDERHAFSDIRLVNEVLQELAA